MSLYFEKGPQQATELERITQKLSDWQSYLVSHGSSPSDAEKAICSQLNKDDPVIQQAIKEAFHAEKEAASR